MLKCVCCKNEIRIQGVTVDYVTLSMWHDGLKREVDVTMKKEDAMKFGMEVMIAAKE